METIKLNLINDMQDFKYPEKAGDAIVVSYPDHLGLVWCCPKCGQVTTTANGHKHIFDPKTNSLSPSIVHAKELGGCGYHGFLTNGVFTNCL